MQWESELAVARRAAEAGGAVVNRFYEQHRLGQLAIRTKGGYDLVSDADVEAERAIANSIREAFPTHAVLGEEEQQGAVESEHLWVVDPLDGTNNFAHLLPHFAVSIAYYCRSQPVCGVVFNPVRNDLYWATAGGGAFQNDRPLRVGEQTQLNQALIGVGFYYDRGAMMEATLRAVGELFGQGIHGIRRFGTASLDLCHVAGGQYGGFLEYELSPWDYAAGRLIVEEAGGRVSTARGEPLKLARGSVLVSNGPLHEPLLAIASRHHP